MIFWLKICCSTKKTTRQLKKPKYIMVLVYVCFKIIQKSYLKNPNLVFFSGNGVYLVVSEADDDCLVCKTSIEIGILKIWFKNVTSDLLHSQHVNNVNKCLTKTVFQYNTLLMLCMSTGDNIYKKKILFIFKI